MQPRAPFDQDKTVHASQYDRSVATAFKNISFGQLLTDGTMQTDNMFGSWWLGNSTPTITIHHNLGIVPIGYLVVFKSAPCDVTMLDSDKVNMRLNCNASGVYLRIFVLG